MAKKSSGENSGKFYEKEQKDKKLKQKKTDTEKQSTTAFLKKKEKLARKIEAQKELDTLKDLLEDGIISDETFQLVEQVAEDNILDDHEKKEILNTIDEIHDNEYIKKHIPQDMLITREEYKKALKDEQHRKRTLIRIDDILGILVQHINPSSRGSINIFSAFALFLLDKNLIKAQEDHIDLKNSLKK